MDDMNDMKKGFTIVELVIVIAVIAILAAVLIPTFSGIIEKAHQSAALQEARGALTGLAAMNNGSLPGKDADGRYRTFVAAGSDMRFFGYDDGALSSVTADEIADSVSGGAVNALFASTSSITDKGYEICASEPENWNNTYMYYFRSSGDETTPIDDTSAPAFTPGIKKAVITADEKLYAAICGLLGGPAAEIFKYGGNYLAISGGKRIDIYLTGSVSEGIFLCSLLDGSAPTHAAAAASTSSATPTSPTATYYAVQYINGNYIADVYSRDNDKCPEGAEIDIGISCDGNAAKDYLEEHYKLYNADTMEELDESEYSVTVVKPGSEVQSVTIRVFAIDCNITVAAECDYPSQTPATSAEESSDTPAQSYATLTTDLNVNIDISSGGTQYSANQAVIPVGCSIDIEITPKGSYTLKSDYTITMNGSPLTSEDGVINYYSDLIFITIYSVTGDIVITE